MSTKSKRLKNNQGNTAGRGGPGNQQGGWSARQQGQRIQERAEEERLGEPRQSGYGGLEQYQHAGSQESPIGPSGSAQSGSGGERQPMGRPEEQPTDAASKPNKGNR